MVPEKDMQSHPLASQGMCLHVYTHTDTHIQKEKEENYSIEFQDSQSYKTHLKDKGNSNKKNKLCKIRKDTSS